MLLCWVTQLAPLPVSAVTNVLQSLTPDSAPQGTNNLVVTFTLSASPPPPSITVPVNSALIGSIAGTSLSRPTQSTVSGTFNIPGNEPTGAKDVTIPFAGSFVAYKAAGFTITPATTLTAAFSGTPTNGIPPLTVSFADASTGTVTNWLWDFGDNSSSTATNPVHTYYGAGSYNVSLTVWEPLGSNTMTRTGYVTAVQPLADGAYVVVDTGQTLCWNNTTVITCPASGQPLYGQDSQHAGNQPAYQDYGDGTITDLTTGLMWVKARGSKTSWEAARTNAAACTVGGYSDWRMPTIKELYSLIKFTGANGSAFTSTAGYIPFIDTNYFGFTYGSGVGNERVIDCQDWSATPYVSTTMNGDVTVFGVNFADGRIKGYPKYDPASGGATGQVMYVRYVRGNPSYGVNNFVNNGDGTITDKAARLMWSRNDSGTGMNWSNALAWVQAQNAANYLGHNDWRLPDAKELQSIVDCTRSPSTSASAAIHPVFNCTIITNEASVADFPFYWAGTTLIAGPGMAEGVYVCFGRAMGYMNGSWLDVHGAGAQRSDLKAGDPADYPQGRGPQGDAVRIYNYVRLVRDVPVTTAWRFAFVGDTHTPLTSIPSEIAATVVNDDARLLIVAGDIVQSGAGASTNLLESQLTQWRAALAPVYDSGIPVYVVRGNHEDDVPGGLPAWNDFFSGTNAMPGNGPAGEINLTYSFTYSNALFLGFDDYVNIHRVNQTWLDQQLASSSRPHIFAFGHEPAFKAFHTDCLDDYPAERNAFWSSLAAAGAKVYLCGHDHFFNVARIDDGDGNSTNDLYQCIVGTGGSTNWPPQRYNYNGANAPYAPVNAGSVTNTYGYLLVEVSGPDTNDLRVTLTWKQRTYDTNTASYLYIPTTSVLSYTATNRFASNGSDGIPGWWRQQFFGGDGATTNADSCAACDPDRDGLNNLHEFLADTDPTNALSLFHILSVNFTNGLQVFFPSSTNRLYTLYSTAAPGGGAWTNVPLQTDLPGSGGVDALTDPSPAGAQRFYRIGVRSP